MQEQLPYESVKSMHLVDDADLGIFKIMKERFHNDTASVRQYCDELEVKQLQNY